MATAHISANKEDVSNIVLMPGDPLRAKFIAETYLEDYKLINDVRNMFGYTGYYKGKKLTVFASGMGNPSVGIYSYELYKNYDVETIIRIGTCGSYEKDIKVFDVILVDKSYSNSTYALNLSNYKENYVTSSSKINEILEKTSNSLGKHLIMGNIHNTDTFYNSDYSEYLNYNCLGVEMETFALFSNAKLLNKNASAILTVSDNLVDKTEISSVEREKHVIEMIEIALESAINI